MRGILSNLPASQDLNDIILYLKFPIKKLQGIRSQKETCKKPISGQTTEIQMLKDKMFNLI